MDMTAFQDCTRIPLVLLNQRDPARRCCRRLSRTTTPTPSR
ncbi:hypothetical protein ACVXG7_03370 [Enterobacter hormaechei]